MSNVSVKYTQNKDVDTLRAAVENQAKWIYYLTDEGLRNGLPPQFAEDAMFELGEYYAETEHKESRTPEELSEKIMKRSMRMGYEADVASQDKSGFDLLIGYCPMVNMWSQLTDDADRKRMLCDVACSMYKGLAEKKGFRFERSEAIAHGCGNCRFHFRKDLE